MRGRRRPRRFAATRSPSRLNKPKPPRAAEGQRPQTIKKSDWVRLAVLRPLSWPRTLSLPGIPAGNLAFRRPAGLSLIERPPDLARQALCDQIPRARTAEDRAGRQRQYHGLVRLTFYPCRQARLLCRTAQLRFRRFRRHRFRRLTSHTNATATSSVIPPVSKAAVAVSTALLKYWKIAHKQSAPPTATKNDAKVIIASPHRKRMVASLNARPSASKRSATAMIKSANQFSAGLLNPSIWR